MSFLDEKLFSPQEGFYTVELRYVLYLLNMYNITQTSECHQEMEIRK